MHVISGLIFSVPFVTSFAGFGRLGHHLELIKSAALPQFGPLAAAISAKGIDEEGNPISKSAANIKEVSQKTQTYAVKVPIKRATKTTATIKTSTVAPSTVNFAPSTIPKQAKRPTKVTTTVATVTATSAIKTPVKRATTTTATKTTTRKAATTAATVATVTATSAVKTPVKRATKTTATTATKATTRTAATTAATVATVTATSAIKTPVKRATTITATTRKPSASASAKSKASTRGMPRVKAPIASKINWTTIPANNFSKLKKYFCYFIISGNKTYNGYTVDLTRRLRQHNGIIQGGAKSTRCGKGGWEYLAVLTAPNWTAVRAMQVEWLCKYPTRKKPRPRIYSRPLGRIKSLGEVCSRLVEQDDMNLHLHLNENYYGDFISSEEAELVPSFITICAGFQGLKIN